MSAISFLSLDEFAARSRYVEPSVGDTVVRYGTGQVGLLYHLDAYLGGLPRAHVVYDDGNSAVECLFLYQPPSTAASDPCWL